MTYNYAVTSYANKGNAYAQVWSGPHECPGAVLARSAHLRLMHHCTSCCLFLLKGVYPSVLFPHADVHHDFWSPASAVVE